MSLARATRMIHPGRTAFFLCDIQERFRPHIHAFPSLVQTAEKLVKASRILDIPLVVTEQNPKGRTAKELDIGHAVICAEKMRFSMVVPEVREWLEKERIGSVVLFGMEAHVCVLQTALDLMEMEGVDVHVVADGVSSINAPEIPIAIARMRDAGVVVSSSESLLFQIMKDAKHAKFREVSALVKEFQATTKVNALLFSSKF